ncbi:sodium-dependent glucose transporter 1-like protein [Dinothrombium tinctorium]|uniref:Sodium-dependent glucose transporter 1-like protein n=1 Tax=Dinothrombium tinctorium TaxID=1965070 RepID=A0A443QES6_9ACAR|nr:sodium-dependent glucose transporter 1-like protein [Dinothrombium tinctorium]
MLLFGVGIGLLPHYPHFGILLANGIVVGFAQGSIDTASSVLVLEMWEKDSNPFLQAIHTNFALGSAISPLVCAPFLSAKTNESSLLLNSTNTTGAEPNEGIRIPFAIGAIISIAAAVLLFYHEMFAPYITPKRSFLRKQLLLELNTAPDAIKEEKEDSKKIIFYTYICVCLGCVLLCFYAGTELMILSFLSTFLINLYKCNPPLHIPKNQAAYMTSAFSTMFTIFRALSIIAATKLRTSTMLYLSFCDIFVAYGIMALYGTTSIYILWAAIAMLGAGSSCVYASIYAFIEKRIDITNQIGGLFMLSCCFLGALGAIIIGKKIEQTPLIFVYTNMGAICFVMILFLILHFTDVWKKSIINGSSIKKELNELVKRSFHFSKKSQTKQEF